MEAVAAPVKDGRNWKHIETAIALSKLALQDGEVLYDLAALQGPR